VKRLLLCFGLMTGSAASAAVVVGAGLEVGDKMLKLILRVLLCPQTLHSRSPYHSSSHDLLLMVKVLLLWEGTTRRVVVLTDIKSSTNAAAAAHMLVQTAACVGAASASATTAARDAQIALVRRANAGISAATVLPLTLALMIVPIL
jgi:hypothetical protein